MSKKSNKKMNLKSLLMLAGMAIVLLIAQHFGLIPPEDSGAPAPAAAGALIDPQEIADYVFTHGELPDNFITKKEAQALGWDSSRNDVSDVAPGKSIGGDRFGNYEGLLPSAKGRTWYEADANYRGGNRGAERIVYSNDGLIYYTRDHYKTFTQLHPSR